MVPATRPDSANSRQSAPAAVGGVARRVPSASINSRTNVGAVGRSNARPSQAQAAGTSKSASSAGSSSKAASNANSKRDGEDVRVFVRVRGRAPNESPVDKPILSTSGPRAQQLLVSYSNEPGVGMSSDAGIEKTYTFDGVFGPDADQSLVYQDVVVPMLNDVMAGYKCTIFAYGQTGTGKTHTMEGNLFSNGTFHLDAGIIPRTLDRLFHQVEMSDQDLTVRATFLELYNEDLRDLLSPDLTAPGSSKPSAAAGLKIYDSKDGAHVQGLWETPISSSEEGLALLRQGSNKRQVASTNCNESSSRSHSIFTLTIYSRDTSPNAKEDDMFRVGKLHLVDLAGSESVERSGVKDKGAREAGIINKSLLTLGRVINALVEGSSHVPYRESNLTRLLQDSLGGGTKTCIIATVSQARSNVDETLSTLDYALRAKSIKNRPELNSKISRPALLRDLESTVKVLQSDLRACISKSGRYTSDENWSLMQTEHEATKRQRDEVTRELENEKSKVATMLEQVEHMAQRDAKRQAENSELRAENKRYKTELAHMQQRNELLEENERMLYSTANDLQSDLAVSVTDADGLRARIERQAQNERGLIEAVTHFQHSLKSRLSEIDANTADSEAFSKTLIERAQGALSGYLEAREIEGTERKSVLRQEANAIKDKLREISAQHGASNESIAMLFSELQRVQDLLLKDSDHVTVAAQESLSKLCAQLSDRAKQQRKETDGAVKTLAADADSIVTLFFQSLQTIKADFDQLRSSISTSANERITALDAENAALQQRVKEQQERLDQGFDRLLAEMNSLRAGQTQGLAQMSQSIQESTAEAKRVSDVQEANAAKMMDTIQDGCGATWSTLEGKQDGLRKAHESIHATIKTQEKAVRAEVQSLEKAVKESIREQAELHSRGVANVNDLAAQARGDIDAALSKEQSSALSLAEATTDIIGASVSHAESSTQAASAFAESQKALLGEQTSSLLRAASTSSTLTKQIRSSAKEQLAARLQPYHATAQTPGRKAYNLSRVIALAPQPQMASRSARSSAQSTASLSSYAGNAPRASDLGRLLQPVAQLVSNALGGGSSILHGSNSKDASSSSRAGSATPTLTPTASSKTQSAVPALKDLSNLPRGGAEDDVEMDDEADAVDTSLGSIKRKHVEVEAALPAAKAAVVGGGGRSKKQRI